MGNLKNNEIIDGILQGIPHVFDYISRDIKPKVIGIIKKKAKSKDCAEEIFHVAMINLFEQVRIGNRINNIENYLIRICLNEADKVTRKEDEDNDCKQDYFDNYELKKDDKKNFLKTIEVMKKLSLDCQKIYELKAEGLTLSEIAEEMGTSEKYLKTKKQRCKKKYIEALNKLDKK